jgi:alcohol dehydrogenase (cytochrome c)
MRLHNNEIGEERVSNRRIPCALSLPLLLAAIVPGWAQQPQTDVAKALTPVTDAMLRNPPPGEWLSWRRTDDGWGYSPLDQINKDNVKNLQVAWSWSMSPGATEMTPIVHGGVIFIYNYGDKVQALNAANGDLIWEYKRRLPEKLVAQGGNALAKRNMAIYEDTLIVATSDAHLLALDTKTGKVVWDHTTSDWEKGYRYTSGPFVAGGKIIQSMSGCNAAQPAGCFITGHDPKTGAEVWRVGTIAKPGEPGGDTWNGVPLEGRFGASAWISGSYDKEQNLVFYGTGQPYPWISEIRGTYPKKDGEKNNALYSDSTLAIDVGTGQIKWHFQHLANDTWDLDYAFERIMVDLPVNGTTHKAIVTVGKLGIIEALDRTTGQWLWHKQTVHQNVVSGVDPKTGEKTINEESIPRVGKTTVNCPADPGSRGWPATAYSPRTGMLYLPLSEYCSNTTPQPIEPGQRYTGGGRAVFSRTPVPGSDGNIGRIDAVKLSDQSTAWSKHWRAPQTSAVLPTAGGLAFAGSLDRWFRAYDDTTGDVLWQVRTNNLVNGFPISYAVDGKQYVAVAVGNGSSQARSLGTLTPEIVNPDGGSTLWVFALPDSR